MPDAHSKFIRYYGLATDFDGTLATDAIVSQASYEVLRRLKASGRKLILVTGRELPDLLRILDFPELFDRVVAENGALLYCPTEKRERLLAEPPPTPFLDLLHRRGVTPLSAGRGIVSTVQPNEGIVLEAIRELGLELHVIFNKGAVMVLPSGCNKATGLAAALKELGLSRHNMVGVGDAENDHAFLEMCEFSVAVANALPALKDRADHVTGQPNGTGISQLIEEWLADDLRKLTLNLPKQVIILGIDDQNAAVRIPVYGSIVLLLGPAGTERDHLVTGLLKPLFEKGYQVCIIDAEGELPALRDTVVMGNIRRSPGVESAVHALDQAQENILASLAGISPGERLTFVERMLRAVAALGANTGRPHWLVLHQAERLLPVSLVPEGLLPHQTPSVLITAARADNLPRELLEKATFVMAMGHTPVETLQQYCAHSATQAQVQPAAKPADTLALAWKRGATSAFWLRRAPDSANQHPTAQPAISRSI